MEGDISVFPASFQVLHTFRVGDIFIHIEELILEIASYVLNSTFRQYRSWFKGQ